MTKSGENTNPGDDLTLVLASAFIIVILLALSGLLVVYLRNSYWTNRGRINGPQHSKVFGKIKVTTSKRRKILKFFNFPSKPHKHTSSTTLMPRAEHIWGCPCCGRLNPRLEEEQDPPSISSIATVLEQELSYMLNLLTWSLSLAYWIALAVICLCFLDDIAEENHGCDG
ncbi:hypothetical protein BsWGS_17446 [Bradybaena similaris]